ncbi:hypothetical protein [Thiofilum flexile]|uniref:hypothetical protein n=1 Tax=Thiofilum flexile TaxID=125627 RepID=UPI0003783156|nr:hypothetical protein [Thiofilum flexile]
MTNSVIELATPQSKVVETTNINNTNKNSIWVTKKKVTFIAITGGFSGGGEDTTENVAENSNTEKIYQESKKISEKNLNGFNGIYIRPGFTSDSTIETALGFIDRTYTKNDKLIIYGYSNGGDFAVELADALKKREITVAGLITVDASDRLKILNNITVNRVIPSNTLVNYNYYQNNPDDCGMISCSHGDENTAEDPLKTFVFNTKITDANVTHRDMEAFAMSDILNRITILVEKIQ